MVQPPRSMPLGQSASKVAIPHEALSDPSFPRRESSPQETPTVDAAKFRVCWGNTSLVDTLTQVHYNPIYSAG